MCVYMYIHIIIIIIIINIVINNGGCTPDPRSKNSHQVSRVDRFGDSCLSQGKPRLKKNMLG